MNREEIEKFVLNRLIELDDFPTIDGRYIEFRRLKNAMIDEIEKFIEKVYEQGKKDKEEELTKNILMEGSPNYFSTSQEFKDKYEKLIK